MTTPRRLPKGARRYPVPAGYPVAATDFPDMPCEYFHLLHTGALMAEDCKRWGWRAVRCANCEQHDLDLISVHGPIPLADFKTKTLPGAVWGKDVSVICPRCTFGIGLPAEASQP